MTCAFPHVNPFSDYKPSWTFQHGNPESQYLLDGQALADADEAEAVALLRAAEPGLRATAMDALRGMLSRKERAVVNRH
jgi:hypothetical protein